MFLCSDPAGIDDTEIKVYSNHKSLGKYEFTILLPVSTTRYHFPFTQYSILVLMLM